jgi:ribose/xylose/arabinose/galactoside ABC-type transport system permease subunit
MKAENMKKKSFLWIDFRESGILFALIILWAVFFITNENFRNIESYMSILREASFFGVATIGMTLCIISGAFDLSVASMLALLSILIIFSVGQFGLVPMIVLIMAGGFLLGTFNGLLVTKLKIPAFIATLAMLFIYRALAYILSPGPIQFQEEWFTSIGNGNVFGVPVPFVIYVILAVLGTLILRRTPLGRYILAIGNSEKASRISGVNIDTVRIVVFGLVGFFVAAASILVSSRLWSAEPGMKVGYEFQVIAAVVLGGTSL